MLAIYFLKQKKEFRMLGSYRKHPLKYNKHIQAIVSFQRRQMRLIMSFSKLPQKICRIFKNIISCKAWKGAKGREISHHHNNLITSFCIHASYFNLWVESNSYTSILSWTGEIKYYSYSYPLLKWHFFFFFRNHHRGWLFVSEHKIPKPKVSNCKTGILSFSLSISFISVKKLTMFSFEC